MANLTSLLVLLVVASLASAKPAKDIIDFETDNGEHEQEGTAGEAVEGEYSWMAPDGTEYFVKYIADHRGYRVIESDVVPKAVQEASQGKA